MKYYWFQIREPHQVLDRVILLGPKLPTFEEFKAKLDASKIEIPADFEQNYFRPCILAMMRADQNDWSHCAFNCEGRIMAMHVWGPAILGA